MAKSIKTPMTPEYRQARRYALRRKYNTIREFATALIQLVHHKDADGHDIGFDYDAILRKFPKVTNNGPHRGKPTKMPIKELQEIACELNRQGVKLPFRPRRKTSSKKTR
jgi:hypothetical protein